MGDAERSGHPGSFGREPSTERPATRRDWEWLPKHPDSTRDLGYELEELDVIGIEDSDRVLFIPEEDSMGESDTFVIIREDDVIIPEA